MVELGITDLPDAAANAEAAMDRTRRLTQEAAALEEARADLRAGRSLTGEALEAWLTRWANGDPVDIEARPAA